MAPEAVVLGFKKNKKIKKIEQKVCLLK